MNQHYEIHSVRSNRKVEFILDDNEPDIIRIKIGSSCLQVLASEVGMMFTHIDSFLAKAIERGNENEKIHDHN